MQFNYSKGNTRLNLCGLELVDGTGNVVASDYHKGFTGNASEGNVYRFNVPYAGDFTLIYYAQNKDEEITSEGKIRLSLAQSDTLHWLRKPQPHSAAPGAGTPRSVLATTGK